MLTLIKDCQGVEETKELEGMLKDMIIAKEDVNNYKNWLLQENLQKDNIERNVKILQ